LQATSTGSNNGSIVDAMHFGNRNNIIWRNHKRRQVKVVPGERNRRNRITLSDQYYKAYCFGYRFFLTKSYAYAK